MEGETERWTVGQMSTRTKEWIYSMLSGRMERREKKNVKFIRTTRKAIEEIGFVPFDMTIS